MSFPHRELRGGKLAGLKSWMYAGIILKKFGDIFWPMGIDMIACEMLSESPYV
jgi:hypothetical protein